MFALGIRYLMGRVVAARWESREEPEWPPHPDRVFMALVAAHAGSGGAEDGANALRFLEALPRPALWASQRYSRRSPVTVYVPANDTASPVQKGKSLAPMGSLPVGRVRQPRQFPAVVPEDPSVYLIWPESVPAGLRLPLERLCQEVSYLGHSSTPVQLWVEDAPPDPTLVPVDGQTAQRLRVFGPGRYDDLRRRYGAGLPPQPVLWQGYAPPAPPPALTAQSVFEENLLVLRQVGGPRFSLESALALGQALRATLMSRAGPGPAPEWLSGHGPDGRPSRREHLAVVALGFVGRQHADGHLLGLGLAVPRDLAEAELAELMRLLDAEPGYPYVNLVVGRLGECHLELDDRPESARPYTLRPATYVGPSARWATVTPLVFDHFPRRRLRPEDVLAEACVWAGLPRPVGVSLHRSPALPGVPHCHSFPTLPTRPSRPPKPLTHAVLSFDRPIRGPILVGAGRYLGYGLCRPCDGGDERQAMPPATAWPETGRES
jgi:CRISPR-associated protein Csb2